MSDEPMPPISTVVEALRRSHAADRQTKLQRLIGSVTDSPHELHQRALLITALREAHLWPPLS